MSFISKAKRVTLGDGVYNIHGNYIIQNVFYGKKRNYIEIEDGPNSLALTLPRDKRCRREDPQLPNGLKRHYTEVEGRLSYALPDGLSPSVLALPNKRRLQEEPLNSLKTKSRTVIVKVFHAATTAREQLESTVALSNHLMHSNILRIEGISSPGDLNQFIAYENDLTDGYIFSITIYWKNAEGPLAAALKNNVSTSVTLGLKMVAGLSKSGTNHLDVQGISLALMRPENFDRLLDIDDRFVLSISPSISSENHVDPRSQPQNDTESYWNLLNALCQKLLPSANYVLHNENIDRDPEKLNRLGGSSVSRIIESSPTARELGFPNDFSENHAVPPRREYVWRTVTYGQQPLSAVATRIALDLDLKLRVF
ncbi:hypothetical protein C8R43DRAFT_1191919 [Mycena crocata]|nr:hypothetical protein C8R43DRAFT_1191919 [Mycena crocata]